MLMVEVSHQLSCCWSGISPDFILVEVSHQLSCWWSRYLTSFHVGGRGISPAFMLMVEVSHQLSCWWSRYLTSFHVDGRGISPAFMLLVEVSHQLSCCWSGISPDFILVEVSHQLSCWWSRYLTSFHVGGRGISPAFMLLVEVSHQISCWWVDVSHQLSGARCSSVVKSFSHCVMDRSFMGWSYFSFQPVFHDWCNKGCGICNPVCSLERVAHVAAAAFLSLYLSGPLPYV